MSRRRLVVTVPCVPSGDLAPWPERFGLCSCGVIVHLVRAAPTVNDWAEESLDGERAVDHAPALLREDPAAWWELLAARDIARYSTLRAAVTLGHWSWWHVHRAQTWAAWCAERVPPYCCRAPMWASPDGWQCRSSGLLFRYTESKESS